MKSLPSNDGKDTPMPAPSTRHTVEIMSNRVSVNITCDRLQVVYVDIGGTKAVIET